MFISSVSRYFYIYGLYPWVLRSEVDNCRLWLLFFCNDSFNCYAGCVANKDSQKTLPTCTVGREDNEVSVLDVGGKTQRINPGKTHAVICENPIHVVPPA